jgi:glycerophosphoryl diester phosphodiesterase
MVYIYGIFTTYIYILQQQKEQRADNFSIICSHTNKIRPKMQVEIEKVSDLIKPQRRTQAAHMVNFLRNQIALNFIYMLQIMRNFRILALLLLIEALVAKMSERVRYPHNIAHRGSSGYIPEHSLQAYQTAMDLQSDYIEPDLCLTKDGFLVAIHDILLDDVTDVAVQYPGRDNTKDVYGIITYGYFVSDFTLAEIKTLKLHQRLPHRSTIYDNLFTIPTLDEIMDLLQKEYETNNITIGLYVEIKYPSFHNSLGFSMKMEDKLLQSLYLGGYKINGTGVFRNAKNVVPVIIQCFESASLVYLRPKTQVPIVQLVEINSSSTELSQTGMISALSKELVIQISQYADGIGPDKEFFTFMTTADGRSLVNLAHSLNLVVHPWTFRADSGILAWQDINNSFYKEQSFFLNA